MRRIKISKSYIEAILTIWVIVFFSGCLINFEVPTSPSSPTPIAFTFTPSETYPLHKNITVTVFWVGEEASEDNEFIANAQSAWDDMWLEHYGGIDDPNHRNGYFPDGFIPHENPFYFALPYNDFKDGKRKPDAYEVVYWAHEKEWGELESMCKNRWIKIIKGDRIAYAQWEDVGPFGEDDKSYVFGTALPQNQINNRAGLDVSPAVRDFLGLSDIDKIDWQFVREEDVPTGPWKMIITTSGTCWKENRK